MSEKKINILFVLIQIHMGGAERVVMELIRSLNPQRFNAFLAYFEEGELTFKFKELCRGTFRIPKKKGFDVKAMLRLSEIIKRYNIDVVNAHHYMPLFYSYLGSKILHKRRLIYTEHSVPEVRTVVSSKHKKVLGFMLRHTDSVVGISKEIGDTFKNSYPRYTQKFQVIVNGVDVDRFANHVDRDQLREQWGISPSHFVVGTVANFRRVKNHACLIRALNQLSVDNPHVRVMLVGQGFPGDLENSEEELLDLINTYGLKEKVIMTGYKDDIAGLMQAFDIFCLPSFSEGLPVSILEAMAAGLPVVGSNVRGINEVVCNGETGLLFASNDETDLARTIERLINNNQLRKSIASRAHYYVRLEHDLKRWIYRYESMLSPS